jgi:hypothetical protein
MFIDGGRMKEEKIVDRLSWHLRHYPDVERFHIVAFTRRRLRREPYQKIAGHFELGLTEAKRIVRRIRNRIPRGVLESLSA